MGVCCQADISIQGEDFVVKIIQDPTLKLNEYDYNRLLNLIGSKRTQQELYKIHIEEFLIPEFYNKDAIDPNTKYLNSIFDYILTQFDEKNNMYAVLLMFYPFINHTDEIIEDTLYTLCQYISGKLTIMDLETILYKHITIFTQGLTYAVSKVCDNQEIIYYLDDLRNNVYTDNNIKNLVNTMLIKMVRSTKENHNKIIVTKEQFKEMLKKYDISSVQSIRSLLMTNY
jgi:hypothetical protein